MRELGHRGLRCFAFQIHDELRATGRFGPQKWQLAVGLDRLFARPNPAQDSSVRIAPLKAHRLCSPGAPIARVSSLWCYERHVS